MRKPTLTAEQQVSELYSTVRAKISDEQFKFLKEYLASRYGLRIPNEKRVLLESRLLSRLNHLKLNSIEEYLNHTFRSKHASDEYHFFVEQITTHKTFFFRENYQFDFLNKILPIYLSNGINQRQLNVWSAGCSTGEEVYTLGMLLQEKKFDLPNLEYRIIGTDISVPSLKKAARGLFSTELENLPPHFKTKYFMEHPNGELQFNNPEIVSRLKFGVLNLNNNKYYLPTTFDFVFCRNVTIYFDAQTRHDVLSRIVDKLKPGGFLFLGHSETAIGMNLPISGVQPTIYQKNKA